MKKGFTLIELIGVLAILGILALITVPLIQNLLDEGEEDSRKMQEASFEKAAKSWGAANVFNLPKAGDSSKITLKKLIDDGFLEAKEDSNGEEYIKISGKDDNYDLNSCVIITNVGQSGTNKYEYEYTEQLSACETN